MPSWKQSVKHSRNVHYQEMMNLLKSFSIWLCFIPAAMFNGGLRGYALVKAIGGKCAYSCAYGTRSACILFPFLSTHVNHCQHT